MSRTKPSLCLVGGGGHALAVAESASAAGFDLEGFFDDIATASVAQRLYLNWLGNLDAAPALVGPRWVLALGDLARRQALLRTMNSGSRAVTIVNPTAVVSASADLGPGTLLGPRALVHCFARIGAHGIINSAAVVEHECVLGENCHIAPGAILAGRVSVGPNTLIGLGARVLPGITIGSNCTIGAGSVVIRNVPDGATVSGVPSRAHAVGDPACP